MLKKHTPRLIVGWVMNRFHEKPRYVILSHRNKF